MTDLILSLFSQVITCSSHPPSSFYRLNAHFSLAIAQHFFFPVSSFLGWHLQTVCHPQVKQPLHKPLSVTYARKLQVSNNNNNNHWKCFTVLFGRSSSVIHSTSCNKGRMAYPPLCGRHTAFLFKSWLCSSCVLAMLWILPIKAMFRSFDWQGLSKRLEVRRSGITLQTNVPSAVFSVTNVILVSLLSLSRKQLSLHLIDTDGSGLCFSFLLFCEHSFSAIRFATCTNGLWVVFTSFLIVWRWFSKGKADMSFNEQSKCATSSWRCLRACTL